MKQQEVFNKIGGIINEIDEQYKYLEANPDKINELELELFVANTRFLVNNAEVLRKISVQEAKPHVQTIAKPIEKYFEPLPHQPEDAEKVPVEQPVPHIDIASDTPSDDYSFLREEPEIIRHELEIDESWADDEDEVLEEPEKQVEQPKNEPLKYISKKSIAEEEVVTINQKISAQLGNKAEVSPQSISDLKSAITLNDKLLYVKELFNGYSLAYSEAIDILNRFKTFEEADKYLKTNYAVKNDWASKPGTVEKFYGLLRRRYS